MYQGRCECDSINYQFSGEPLTCYACHCSDCQSSSGSAFGMSMIVNDKDINVTHGKMAVNNIDVNGARAQKHYCQQCGSTLWFSADDYPGILVLKPGTFNDTSWFKPVAHLWMRSSQPWIRLDEETPRYEKQPEMSELIKLWATRGQHTGS